ncbi:MAG: hypothetical protein KC502_13585 [Myxococcales bacterium]|nr:hypothetical protein [Myxococcales bacterium]
MTLFTNLYQLQVTAPMRRKLELLVTLSLAGLLSACVSPSGNGGGGGPIGGSPVDGSSALIDATDGGASNLGDTTSGTAAPDTGVPDTGVADTGAIDSGLADTGPADTGPTDTAPADAGSGGCKLMSGNVLSANTNINVVTSLSILSDKKGCDLDGDQVPNNVLGKVVGIYPAANTALKDAVDDGTLILLFAPEKWLTNGQPFVTDLLIGDVASTSSGCKPSGNTPCDYTVAPSSYDEFASGAICPAKVSFTPTTVNGGQMKAGGNNQKFELDLPFVGVNLKLTITQAQITGSVTSQSAWMNTSSGMLCGVISKDDLNKAIDALPPAALQQTGFDKATIKSLVSSVLAPDIDTNKNGTKDAISVALGLETKAGKVVGLSTSP